jgi:uncharacterized protein YqgC (DUF456 family)
MGLDILLVVLGILALLIGLAGSVLPFPGPPISFVGLLLIHWTSFVDFTSRLLWAMALLTIVVTLLDMLVPMWGVKKFGGTKYGMWGSAIGLVVGLFGGPAGIFIGAFLGGLVGELIAGSTTESAMKAAMGSFIGFLFGSLLKVILSCVMIWYAAVALIQAM